MGFRVLRCSSHGRVLWSGEVICVGCNAVWHLGGGDEPPTEDGTCTCGKKLSGEEGTARAICGRCYKSMKRPCLSG